VEEEERKVFSLSFPNQSSRRRRKDKVFWVLGNFTKYNILMMMHDGSRDLHDNNMVWHDQA